MKSIELPSCAGRHSITTDTDHRLCRFFGLSNGYWLRAQAAHDTEVAEATLAKALTTIKPWSDAEKRNAAWLKQISNLTPFLPFFPSCFQRVTCR